MDTKQHLGPEHQAGLPYEFKEGSNLLEHFTKAPGQSQVNVQDIDAAIENDPFVGFRAIC